MRRFITAAAVAAMAPGLVAPLAGCTRRSGAEAASSADTDPEGDGAALPQGTVYGAGVSAAQTMPVSRLVAEIDAYAGKRVRVEGLVIDVCAKRGCWLKIASDAEFEDLTFKVDDGVIVFPLDARGRYAVLEGVARKRELTLEQTADYLAHLAEEKGEPFDRASVTAPRTLVMLEGQGAVIRDQR